MVTSLDSLIKTFHNIRQLPYRRLDSSAIVHELAPRKSNIMPTSTISTSRSTVPDLARAIFGEQTDLVVYLVADDLSIWHSITYAILTETYQTCSWGGRKEMISQLIEAVNLRLCQRSTPLMTGTNLKSDMINTSDATPTPELLYAICLFLNINIATFSTRSETIQFYWPTPVYACHLPVIVLCLDERCRYSVMSINGQTIQEGNGQIAQLLFSRAPKHNVLWCRYLVKSCPAEIYAAVKGISLEETQHQQAMAGLMRFKLTELKALADNRGILYPTRSTKQILIDLLKTSSDPL